MIYLRGLQEIKVLSILALILQQFMILKSQSGHSISDYPAANIWSDLDSGVGVILQQYCTAPRLIIVLSSQLSLIINKVYIISYLDFIESLPLWPELFIMLCNVLTSFHPVKFVWLETSNKSYQFLKSLSLK